MGESIVSVEDQVFGRGRRRGLVTIGALALAVAACALVGGGLAPSQALAKKPPRLIHNNSPVKVTCVPGPSGTVRARISTRMTVVNYDGWADWADHMEAKVRLEPTTPGLNYSRAWRAAKTPYLIQNKRHAYNMTPLSDNVSGTADWQAHVKLIWHRPAPIKNVTKDLYLAFSGSCAGGVTSASP
jgi:hypothetical protein